MNSQNMPPNDTDKSAVQLLQDINTGILNPKILDASSRQKCVELLIAEGYTYPQISQVLRCSEKTIARDVKKIQSQNALTPNVEFAKQFIGDVFQKAMSHHSFLVRTARAKDTSPAEKIQAEYAAWKILKEIVEALQTLGYLPLKPKEVTGELYHHIAVQDGDESVIEVKRMLSEIESVAKDTGTYSEELVEEIKLLSARLEKAEVAEEAKKLMDKQKKAIEEKEEEDEK